jgi:O-antigen polymerase
MPTVNESNSRSYSKCKSQNINVFSLFFWRSGLINYFFVNIVISVFFCVSFINTNYLFNGIVVAKWALFELGLGIAALSMFVSLVAFHSAKMEFNKVDLLFVVIVGYLLASTIVKHTGIGHDALFYLFGTVCFWLFIKISSTQIILIAVLFLYLLTGIAQSAMGLLQIYGLQGSNHGLFALTGTFHNPGPLAGYLASGMPIALGILLTKRERKLKQFTSQPKREQIKNSTWSFSVPSFKRLVSPLNQHILVLVAQSSIVLLLLVLPATRSRASWVAVLAGSLFTCWPMLLRVFKILWNRKLQRFRQYFTTTVLFGVAIAVVLSCSAGLYFLKKDSANGRLLMWQVSWQLVKEEPFLGHGWNSFGAKYMDAQAQWFANGNGSDVQKLVAGEPEAPFNEPIRLLVELGLVGFLMIAAFFTLLIAALLRMQKRTNIDGYLRGIGGGIVTILVFSLFSYPMDVAPIMAQLLVLTAVLGSATSKLPFLLQNEPSHCIKNKIITWFQTQSRWLASVLCIGFGIVVLTLIPARIRHYQALSQWAEANQLYQIGVYEAAARQYATANEQLGDDGLFLQMYAKCMQMQGFNKEALALLETALQNHNGTIVQLTMGDCHAALGDYAKATAAYQAAWNMIPSRLYPGYKLALLYQQMGENALARATAQKVLDMPIKVQSTAVAEIREQMAVISEQWAVNSEQ